MNQAHASQKHDNIDIRRFTRLAAFGLLSLLLLVVFPRTAAKAADESIPAYSARNNGCPYYICVNRAANTVTVYGLDEDGYYTIPVKAMVCSVGREGHATPKGTFAITGVKKTWCYMVDGTYGQYSSQFRGNYLFHSICYQKANPATMLTDEYNMLGERASRGCVRLQVADAKWIYENCEAGTKVTIYESDNPGPLGKPAPALDEITPDMDNGWDPTDPRDNNPWRNQIAADFTISEKSIALESGLKQNLEYTSNPPGALLPRVSWTSSDPTVAVVDNYGQVIALNAGKAVITGTRGEFSDSCEITVTGDLLPFTDIPPGMWNYREIRYVYQNHIISGLNDDTFLPDGSFTWADALQALYNLAGTVSADDENTSPAASERAWYRGALDWAREYSLIGIQGGEIFEPGRAISRQEFALLLYRYDTIYLGYSGESEISLQAYPDARELDWEAAAALRWMLENKIMAGTDEGKLNPDGLTTRSHAAVFFYRYHQIGHGKRQFHETLLLRQRDKLFPILPAAPIARKVFA